MNPLLTLAFLGVALAAFASAGPHIRDLTAKDIPGLSSINVTIVHFHLFCYLTV